MTDQAWGATLSGHAFDLQDWKESLLPPHEPWVEEWILNETSRLVLRSSIFENFTNGADVWNAAKALVVRLNGALAVHNRSQSLTVEGVMERRLDGSFGQHVIFAPGAAHGRTRVGGISTGPQIGPTSVQKWLELADRNELIDDLLMHQSGEANWHDLYKAYELVKELCGGQAGLEMRAWCPLRLGLFRHTANLFRHSSAHSSHQNPPAQPMPLPEAVALVRTMTGFVLREQLSEPTT